MPAGLLVVPPPLVDKVRNASTDVVPLLVELPKALTDTVAEELQDDLLVILKGGGSGGTSSSSSLTNQKIASVYN